jgi:hypothetical protein
MSMKRSKTTASPSRDHRCGQKPPREEHEIFSDLAALCASPGFAHAIAFFCYRDNLVRYGKALQPDDLAHLNSRSGLIRAEISTLIGLLARQSIDYTLHEPAVIQGYLDQAQALLHELHRALSSLWFKGLDPETFKAEGPKLLSAGPALREPIFYGGDSAYSFQYREFTEKKYGNDRDWLLAHKGFGISTALVIANALRDVLVEQLIAIPKVLKTKPSREWTVLPAFCFSSGEVAHRSGIEPAVVRRVIEAFCLQREDRNAQFTSLQQYNAMNASPILSLGGDEFVLFQHYSLMEALYESPFFWMAADRSYAPTALTNRGRFTEELASEQLQRVFGLHVYANVHLERKKGDEIGEIDILVIFGDRAIVLQAKSKRLTLEARKGNDFQIKDDFKKAIQASYDQALVCSKALLEGNCRIKNSEGREIVLASPIKQLFPVCIMADHYPALAFQARQFLKYEATEKIAPPLVTDVFALDAITEMLETPLRVLSYLDLRSIHGEKILAMHELSLLSTHIKYNLWVDEKYDFVHFTDDLGIHLDAAMAVRREGLPGDHTPDGILTRLKGTHVGRIVSQIESTPEPATIDLELLLLSLDEDSTDTINRGIRLISAQAAKDGRNHDFTAGFGASSSGLTIHCNNRPHEAAVKSLFTHCGLRKYSQKAFRWFGLAISPTDGAVRFGLDLEGEWKQDSEMDEAVRGMLGGVRPDKLIGMLKAKNKLGRNDPCPCGSGRKYKRCCLPSNPLIRDL